MKNNAFEKLIVIVCLTSVFAFFIHFIYPSVNDFNFWHMKTAILADKLNSVNMAENNGFYATTVMLSKICNIPYDIIPTLPFQLASLTLMLLLVLRGVGYNSYFWLAFTIIYLTSSIVPSPFTWNCHDMGFVLFLVVIFVVIMRFRVKSINCTISTSIILVVTIIAINFISYKLTFATICLLLSLLLIEWFKKIMPICKGNVKSAKISVIALIGIVFVLAFNKFFYETFIPVIRFKSKISSSTGLDKILRIFTDKVDPSLSKYYFTNPAVYVHMLWIVIVLSLLVFCLLYIFKKIYKGENIYDKENVFVAIVLSGFVIMFVYTMIGFTDMNFLILAGLVGLSLFANAQEKFKNYAIVLVVVLLALNFFNNYLSIQYNVYSGQKGDFQYLDLPSNWYMNYAANKNSATDVFTAGFFNKELAKNENLFNNFIHVFNKKQLLLILEEKRRLTQESLFIINYREKKFSTIGWNSFKSWANYKQKIKNNCYLEVIYSIGDVGIVKNVI